MQNLQIQDITELYVWVDDMVENFSGVGRPSILSDSEILTILLWWSYFLRMKHIKSIYEFIQQYHRKDFPRIPDYSNFVRHGQRLIPQMTQMLLESFDKSAVIRFADSTMVPVCKNIRAESHKVAQRFADFGKNWQGWHFGFKLHASVNPQGKLCSIHFTPASHHDVQSIPYLLKGNTKILVGDTHYGASVMKNRMWKEKGVFILAPPHPKQNKKLSTTWQIKLLQARPRIESVWDILKEHFHLVTSFPRSILGYLFHYLRILLAYQLSKATS